MTLTFKVRSPVCLFTQLASIAGWQPRLYSANHLSRHSHAIFSKLDFWEPFPWRRVIVCGFFARPERIVLGKREASERERVREGKRERYIYIYIYRER